MPFRKIPVIDGIWGYTGTDHGFMTIMPHNNPALTTFECRFLGSDHHVRSLRVGGMVEDSQFLLMLTDHDYGVSGGEHDRVHLKARYFYVSPCYLSSDGVQTISGTSRNRSENRIPLSRPHENDLFVLRGFEFEGLPERNHHLRQITVRYNYSDDELLINFIDDSPQDDTYVFIIHYMFLKSSCEIPTNYSFEGPNTLAFNFTNSARRIIPDKGRALLGGFSFRFLDGDHHLKNITIDLYPRDQINVTFTDNERTHPVEAIIDYIKVIL